MKEVSALIIVLIIVFVCFLIIPFHKNDEIKYEYQIKNNTDKKELEIFFNGNKVKSFHNPNNDLFANVVRAKTLYITIYTFEAYRVVAKGYCSDGIGCNIDILKDNHRVKESIRDSEIIQNKEIKRKSYQVKSITGDFFDLYFNKNLIKTFPIKGGMRIVPLEVEDGVFFELREYLGLKQVGHLRCEKTCIVETYY